MKCGGASPEDYGPTPLGIASREKGANSDGDQTRC